jgi:hypothetical protein
MFDIVHMPRVELSNYSSDLRNAVSFGWILIFDMPDGKLMFKATNDVASCVHNVMTSFAGVSRVWVSPLTFDPECIFHEILDFINSEEGTRINGNLVSNMPFDFLIAEINENIGFGHGEVWYDYANTPDPLKRNEVR